MPIARASSARSARWSDRKLSDHLADVKRKDIVAAGTDQVAIDAFGATLLGYKPQEIGYVVEGHARRLGTIDFESLKPRRIEVG